MSDIVHHLPPAAVDSLRSLIGCEIALWIVRGGLSDRGRYGRGLYADDLVLLTWPRGVLTTPRHIERAIVFGGHIEDRVWIAISAEERPVSDLVALGVLDTTEVRGRAVQTWSKGFSLFPARDAPVTSVEIFHETFTVDAGEARGLPAQTVTSDCRINFNLEGTDPICLEVGAAGIGFFLIHRSRSAWFGGDTPSPTMALRHSFTTPVHA